MSILSTKIVGIIPLNCIPGQIPTSWTMQNIYYFVASIAAITATSFYAYNVLKDRKLEIEKQEKRQNDIYDSIDNKYMEYLQLCLENIELDVYDIPDEKIEGINKKEIVAYTMLITIFERAFLEYKAYMPTVEVPKNLRELRDNQWPGWEEYILRFTGRPNFQKSYKIWIKEGVLTYDFRFDAYMKKKMKENGVD
jgi:hypothetical protein